MSLTPVQRLTIVALRDSGLNVSNIADRVGVTRRTVYAWLKRFDDEGNVERHPPHPRQRATTAEQDNDIVAAHSLASFTPTRVTATLHNVSMETVRRRLRAAGIYCRRPAKKPSLTQAHRDERISFALEYYNFDWENEVVIFSDEKTFRSDRDGRKILWRRNNERYHEANVLPNRSSGRISIGFWGWMSSMGPGEICEIHGRMNAEEYLDVLKNVLVPTVKVAYPDMRRVYFAQDNCSFHQAHIVRNWLAMQDYIMLINWPSKSPDLNPIENLWGQIILNWDPSDIRNIENLRETVMTSWEHFRGRDLCWNMVRGMKNRLRDVLDANGGYTKY
ncbi:Transposable element Tc3 transposase [Eumeta japonica]|uniref:Transposable element Tc3 transposase n=1 Tax=Eumeta variegata TaxID=151549 RepID=A0A4C1SDN7_EUMVA|nr:Transposable element Tc3 transposase [Eumeta japonica]